VTGDIGELVVSGPELFHGYLDAALNDESFTADGFFRTGDLASFDERGNVIIRGRKKDIIIRKGENISAKEVEDHLFEHAQVDDVAVVAVPDPTSGERACAVVVTANAELTLDDLRRHLRARGVAVQKWPEQLEIASALPRTASGKVQKFLLRQQLAGASSTARA
jgi:cyclohexanecarboxylate-CoA ligase